MTSLNPCWEELNLQPKTHNFNYVTIILVCNGEVVSKKDYSLPMALLKISYLLLVKLLFIGFFLLFRFARNIKDFFFPYCPTEDEVKQYYEDGNGYFDKMTNEEKAKFLKKDTSFPLGL